MPRDTRLLYVENDPVLRSMLSTLLSGLPGFEVVASVGGSAEALACELPVDVALLDWALGPESLNGVELGHALRKRDENIGIVILSTYRDPRLVAPGVVPPPRGTVYLSKQDVHDFSQVIGGLQLAAETPVARRSTPSAALPSLTDVQLEVLQGIAEGMSTQALADQRDVSVKAIEQTISRLYEVFEVPRDGAHNQRVRLARAYLQLVGKVDEQATS